MSNKNILLFVFTSHLHNRSGVCKINIYHTKTHIVNQAEPVVHTSGREFFLYPTINMNILGCGIQY